MAPRRGDGRAPFALQEEAIPENLPFAKLSATWNIKVIAKMRHAFFHTGLTTMTILERLEVVDQLISIIRAAGDVVMTIYDTDFTVRGKDDASPVTEADERAEALIVPALHALLPGVPVVAEEAAAAGDVPEVGTRFWLVDPLDGTKEFISRNGEFTVNIALVEDSTPVLGVVFAPALSRLFGGAVGGGVFLEDAAGRRSIQCRRPPADGLTVVASRSHGDAAALDAFLAGRPIAAMRNAGSSLKLCLIAAGHAVLAAAGGEVTTLAGKALAYGKPGFENPHFVAHGPGC